MPDRSTDFPSQTEPSKVREKRRPCSRCGCIAGVLLLLCFAALACVRFYLQQSIPRQTWTHIREFETKVVSLSPEWHQPATLPPPETLQLLNRINSDVEPLRVRYDEFLFGDYSSTSSQLLARMRAGVNLSSDEDTTFVELLADLQPLLDLTTRTVSIPGYTYDLDFYTTDPYSFLHVQVYAKLASIAALHQAREGDCFRAMETAVLPIRLVHRQEHANNMAHLIATAVTVISIHTVSALADQCSDTLALQHGLDLLDNLRKSAFPGEIKHWRYGDYLGYLRHVAATGYEVDLTPQPMAGYLRQVTYLQNGKLHRWMVKNLPTSDQRVMASKARMDRMQKQKEEFPEIAAAYEDQTPALPPAIYTIGAKLLTGADPYALLYGVFGTTMDEMETRALIAKAQYEVTRTKLALKLGNASNASPVTAQNAATTINAYLHPGPIDPFTSAPFTFSQTINGFYSVGPDKKDDNVTLLYDATNGTYSGGDVWMNRE